MDGFCVRLSAEIPQCERPHGPRWQVQVGELWVGAQGDPPFRRAQINRMPSPPPPSAAGDLFQERWVDDCVLNYLARQPQQQQQQLQQQAAHAALHAAAAAQQVAAQQQAAAAMHAMPMGQSGIMPGMQPQLQHQLLLMQQQQQQQQGAAALKQPPRL